MKEKKKSKIIIKKLNQDDILEIIFEHFQEIELKEAVITKGIILGTPGKDLRFVGVFGDETCEEIYEYDLEEIDENQEFNGSHAFLENNPNFCL
ncbi:hypothetical protein [Clostridium sp. JNZ J1-5]